jgi:molybdate transport system permease protein
MDKTAALEPLLLTLKVAGIATLFAFLIGVLIGYALSKERLWARRWLDAFFTLPLALPPTVLGYYLLTLVGRNGLMGRWLEDTLGIAFIFTWQGAALASTVVSTPLVIKSARAAFESVEKNLENAGRTLGLTELEVFLRISFPLSFRGILAGTMLAFARAMGEFGATLMVAGNLPGKTQTLSLAVYNAIQAGNDALATYLVMIITIVCMVILVASDLLSRTKNDY